MFSAKKISPEEADAHRIIIDDSLTKPVNPKKLLEAIAKVLARQEFNRQIIRTWNAAGVSQAIIDEYLTLKTNLDVDVSLLAVMQKQLDIAYPDAANRDELARSVAALEGRIGLSRARIQAFCQERAVILPILDRDDERLPVPGPDPVAVPARDPAGSTILPSPLPGPASPPKTAVSPAENLPVPGVPAAPGTPAGTASPGPARVLPVMTGETLSAEERPSMEETPPVVAWPVITPLRDQSPSCTRLAPPNRLRPTRFP